jgi:hypothetical protein
LQRPIRIDASRFGDSHKTLPVSRFSFARKLMRRDPAFAGQKRLPG